MNYIKLFKNPDSKLQKAITDSYEFYNNDVNPRRNRERNFIQQKYTTDIPIESIPMKIGAVSLLGTSNREPALLDVERYYIEPTNIRIPGQISIPLNYNYFPIEDLSRFITRNISAEDYYQTRAFGKNTNNFYQFLQKLIGNHNMTFKEAKYLNDAYPSEIIINENNGRVDYNIMNTLVNKQGANRELRHYLYQQFIKDNKRNPRNLNEFDKYIIQFDNEELLHILRHLNESTEFYLHDINKKIFDPSYDYDDFVTKPAEKIKQSLIHVSQNNYQNSFDNQNIQYAKLGQKLNYLNLFK